MLKLAIMALSLACAVSISVRADEPKKEEIKPKRPALTEEQKKIRKEIVEKYDTNKDGKLDAEERKAITAEDREKLSKAGRPARKAKEVKEDAK